MQGEGCEQGLARATIEGLARLRTPPCPVGPYCRLSLTNADPSRQNAGVALKEEFGAGSFVTNNFLKMTD